MTIANLLFKAQKYMNAKDILASKGITKWRRREKENKDHPERRNEGKFTHSPQKRSKGQFTNFTPLVMPPSQILM